MRVNYSNPENVRFLDRGKEKIKAGRTQPNGGNGGMMDCSITGQRFYVDLLDETSTVFVTDTYMNDVIVYCALPELVRKLREILLIEDEWVVLSTSDMPPTQAFTIRWLFSVSYQLRRMFDDHKFVFDQRHWERCLRMALTGDWGNDAIKYIKSGKLDVDYMMQIAVPLLQPEILPCKFYYTVMVTNNSKSYPPIYGFYISPKQESASSFVYTFRRRYDGINRESLVIEQGSITFDSFDEAIEKLEPALRQVDSVAQITYNIGLDLSATLGVCYFNRGCNRFLYTWETN